jgi:predicted Zn-dependent protease with MMP-like domain
MQAYFLDMSLEEFEDEVTKAVEELPAEFKSQLDNVDILVEIWPTETDLKSILAHPGTTLFGLYKGVPKTKRGNNYSAVLPDKITIYAGPILSLSPSLEDAKKQIRKTVLHEIGHYFGMSEESIRNAQKDY